MTFRLPWSKVRFVSKFNYLLCIHSVFCSAFVFCFFLLFLCCMILCSLLNWFVCVDFFFTLSKNETFGAFFSILQIRLEGRTQYGQNYMVLMPQFITARSFIMAHQKKKVREVRELDSGARLQIVMRIDENWSASAALMHAFLTINEFKHRIFYGIHSFMLLPDNGHRKTKKKNSKFCDKCFTKSNNIKIYK